MQTNTANEQNKNVVWWQESVESVQLVRKRPMVKRICQKSGP